MIYFMGNKKFPSIFFSVSTMADSHPLVGVVLGSNISTNYEFCFSCSKTVFCFSCSFALKYYSLKVASNLLTMLQPSCGFIL